MKRLLTIAFTTLALLSSGTFAKQPKEVKVVNFPPPFCPCFSSTDVDNVFSDAIVGICRDDRNQSVASRAETAIVADGERTLVNVVSRNGEPWECLQRKNDTEIFIKYLDIGVAGAVACRLEIINSQAWTRCPPE